MVNDLVYAVSLEPPHSQASVVHSVGTTSATLGSARIDDAFVHIPSFDDMLVSDNARIGREGDSATYTGWAEKGESSFKNVCNTKIIPHFAATSPHSNPRLTG